MIYRKLSRLCLWGAVVAIFCAVSGCINDDEPDTVDEVWSLKVGDRCPEFSVVSDGGETVSDKTIEGKGAVIVFFNTSCSDCRRELPQLQRRYEAHIADGVKSQWICISREENAASVSAYWKAHDLTMPYSAQTDRKVYDLFANSGIPRIYEISPELIITSVSVME